MSAWRNVKTQMLMVWADRIANSGHKPKPQGQSLGNPDKGVRQLSVLAGSNPAALTK